MAESSVQPEAATGRFVLFAELYSREDIPFAHANDVTLRAENCLPAAAHLCVFSLPLVTNNQPITITDRKAALIGRPVSRTIHRSIYEH